MTTEIINELGVEDVNIIIDSIKTIYDPEIDINIFDLALIYKIVLNKEYIHIYMTLTSANCPEAQSLPELVRNTIQAIFKQEVLVEVVFEPIWTIDNLEDHIKLELGLF